jgi:hypothetical protein
MDPRLPEKDGQACTYCVCVLPCGLQALCLSIDLLLLPFAGAAAASRESKSKRYPGNEGEIDNVHIVETSQMKGKREKRSITSAK